MKQNLPADLDSPRLEEPERHPAEEQQYDQPVLDEDTKRFDEAPALPEEKKEF